MHYVEEQNLGMVCYSGGVLLYIVLLWPLVTKLRLQYYLILLIVTTLLFWLSVTGLFRLTPDLFYVFVYGWLVVLFFVSTLIVYFHQRNKISASALLAGTLLLGGTINTALSMFFGVSLLLQIITVFSFSCMHYAVQHYVILLRIEKKDSFVEL
ncbi:MAG: hypothetical protein OIF50_02715 [Flavobacteriaceae bacterium]|nr:hypothetical protein [Flavobacteriaceae bacterium]